MAATPALGACSRWPRIVQWSERSGFVVPATVETANALAILLLLLQLAVEQWRLGSAARQQSAIYGVWRAGSVEKVVSST